MPGITQESCYDYCTVQQKPPYPYIGMDSGTNCRCGDSLNFQSQSDPTQCQTGASGNSTEAAGDLRRMSLWRNTAYVAPKTSLDATCGGTTGNTCTGSVFGNCCSQSGYCGSTSDYCGTGCQPRAGQCSPASSSSIASATPSARPSGTVSLDGSCGGTTGKICTGSVFGDCCSQNGYCGRTADYCGTGCQPSAGQCSSTSSSFISLPAIPTPSALPSGIISTDGSCGGTTGKICTGSVFGDCCSQNGYCGRTSDYCGAGCQPSAGQCSSAPSSPSASARPSTLPVGIISPDATCGGSTGYICTGSTFGNCCSRNGYCGSTSDYCGTGCQPSAGQCSPASSLSTILSTPALATPSTLPVGIISPDATCGGSTGYICTGSAFGNCCSRNGYCGSTSDYCGTGCQPSAGQCSPASGISVILSTPALPTSSALPSPSGIISPDATCGGTTGYICTGSTFGNCCSQSGYCGSTSDYCGTGCQPSAGQCSPVSSLSISPSVPALTVPSALPSPSGIISPDATCGGSTGYICTGSAFGNCCSRNGYCGSSSDYCGDGCQPGAGLCLTSSPSISPSAPALTVPSALPSPSGIISPDATCGGSTGYICTGSAFGNCCSRNGYCGSSSDYCGDGCQPAAGQCLPVVSSLTVASIIPSFSTVTTSSTAAQSSSVRPIFVPCSKVVFCKHVNHVSR